METKGNCMINLDQSWERHYWTVRWGIGEEQLKDAIRAVGSKDARRIEQWLVINDLIS